MRFPKWLQRLSNATIKASIAADPAVATASGWTINNGEAQQNATEDPGVQQLRENLAVLGSTATGITAAPLIATPAAMRALDVIGTIDGARNLTTDNGIAKTIRLVKQGDYGRAALSGLGDTMDLVGIGDAARMAIKLGNKAYRGYHAFNTITPYSYDNMFGKGKDWIKSMLLEKKYTTPSWKGGEVETDFLKEIKGVLGENPKNFAKLAREDAWAIYTGQTPKHGMYIKNADGTFSYNPEKLKEFYANDESFGDLLKYTKDNKYDAIGVTHGGLWKAESSNLATVGEGINKRTIGNLRIEDMWDINPFEREGYGLIGAHVNDALSKKVGSQALRNKAQSFREWMYENKHWGSYGEKDSVLGTILKPLDRPLNIYRGGWKRKLVKSSPDYQPMFFTLGDDAAPAGFHFEDVEIPRTADKIIDAITDNKLTRAIDKKLKGFEVGPLVGGKPFYMATDIPYTAHLEISPEIKAFDPENLKNKIEFGKVIPEDYLDPLKVNKFDAFAKNNDVVKDLTTSVYKQGGTISAQHGSKLLNKWQQLYDSKFGKGLRDFMYGYDHDLSDEEYMQKHGHARPLGSSGMLGFLVAPEFEGLEFPEITAQHFGSIGKPKSIVEFGPIKGTTVKPTVKAPKTKPRFSKAMKQSFKERTGFDIESAPQIMQERELAEWQKYVDRLRKAHKRQ